ncbi:DIE2/ALG10 family protein [Tanacetum coccineum]
MKILTSSLYDGDVVSTLSKPEGSIEEGYVAEEALSFCSHYFRSIGKRSVIRLDHQELKKVIWYVLHNNPEIDMYLAKFKREFPNHDMKEEFPGWFGPQICRRYIGKDPSISDELFSLACGPTSNLISVNSCIVNGVSLNDLDFTTLNIDGQSTDVEAPQDIIDVDEDDDFIDDEDDVPYDLADSDDEVLANDDDDDVVMSASVARGHGGDGGSDDPSRPPPRPIRTGCRGKNFWIMVWEAEKPSGEAGEPAD